MRRDLLPAAVIPLAFFLASCAPITVGAHRASDVDFSGYHSFAWGPADALPTGDPRLDNNPFFHDYLQGAVERHLRGHAIVLVGTSDRPDLLLHYHATVAQRIDVASLRERQGQSGHYGEPSIGDSEPLIRGYDESTLVLDMIDARTGRLVWRGWAQESLQNFVNDQDALKAHIEKSVVQMLQRLPL
jgi:hypothetical protein